MLANGLGLRLVLVQVIPPPPIIAPYAPAPPLDVLPDDALAEQADLDLEHVACAVGKPDAERIVLQGNASTGLLRAVVDVDATLLVVGSRGRGSWRAAVAGSVSGDVARAAPCPVVVVPRGAETADDGRLAGARASPGWP